MCAVFRSPNFAIVHSALAIFLQRNAHALNGYLCASSENFDTDIRFFELNFLIKNDILAMLARFL